MHPVLITILGREIRFYGIMIALGFMAALYIAKKEAKEDGIDTNVIENFAFVGMASGVIGARIYYVLFNWGYYSQNLSEIFAIWHGGLAIHGGIIGGALGGWIFAKIKHMSILRLGDIAAAPFLLGQTLGRVGNFMNGEIHGVPTFTPWKIIFHLKPMFYQWYNTYLQMSPIDKSQFKPLVPWGVIFPNASPAGSEFPGIALHPAMLYELVLNFIGFLVIYFVLRKSKTRVPGYLWWSYLIIYAVIRSFVSCFRAEDLMFFGIRAPHVISIVMIVVAFIGMMICKKIYKKPRTIQNK